MSNKIQRAILKFADDTFIKQLERLLLETGRVKVTDLGVFEIRQYKERKAWNVGTQKDFILPARKRLVFLPTKLLREAIQKHEGY